MNFIMYIIICIYYTFIVYTFIYSFLFIFPILWRGGKIASLVHVQLPFRQFHIYRNFVRSVSLGKFRHVLGTFICCSSGVALRTIYLFYVVLFYGFYNVHYNMYILYVHSIHLFILFYLYSQYYEGVERKLRCSTPNFPLISFIFIAVLFVQLIYANLDTFWGHWFISFLLQF